MATLDRNSAWARADAEARWNANCDIGAEAAGQSRADEAKAMVKALLKAQHHVVLRQPAYPFDKMDFAQKRGGCGLVGIRQGWHCNRSTKRERIHRLLQSVSEGISERYSSL